MKKIFLSAVMMLCMCAVPRPAPCCTTFCLKSGGQVVVGKNFDLFTGECVIFVNKRGVSKKAMVAAPDDTARAEWTSRYGSVTFNPDLRERPFSGINEAGLVVSTTSLYETEYPATAPLGVIDEFQWAQYQLDNYSTVKQVVDNAGSLRVLKIGHISNPAQYLVADATGDCAVIEFVQGRAVCYRGEGLPVAAITDNTYPDSLAYWQTGVRPWRNSMSSVERFKIAAAMLSGYRPDPSRTLVDDAFAILKAAALGEVTEVDGEPVRSFIATEWSIVYDAVKGQVYFHTFADKNIRRFMLAEFDFSCTAPVMALNIQADTHGDAGSAFTPYTREINLELLKKAVRNKNRYTGLDAAEVERLAGYPESTICTQERAAGEGRPGPAQRVLCADNF